MNYIRIARELKDSIKGKIPSEPYKVIAYGSFARNEENKNSDLDVLIIFNMPVDLKVKDTVYEICNDLNIKYEVWIDVSFLSLSEMSKKYERMFAC